MILTFCVGTLPHFAFAQETHHDIELFVPEKMIAGYPYHGMVTLKNPSPVDSLIVLSTVDDFVLESDQSVSIHANQNHGIFNLMPHHVGESKIFASFNGGLVSDTTTIYAEKSGPKKLEVILPGNSTLAENLRGFVFLKDGNGFPTVSDFDRTISLLSAEKIIIPPQVTIFNGTTHASFDMQVMATGDITATGIGLVSGSAHITKSQEVVDVKIAIAPNIALENSYVNYFVWLEQNGRPYKVPYILKVELQSSNTDVLRLGVSPSSYQNTNTVTISMQDGMAAGRLYTGERGLADVFASVPEYGHASAQIYVGPVRLVEDAIIPEDPLTKKPQELTPNHIQFWVYPETTDDVAYGVAALYHSETQESISVSINDDGTQITNVVENITLVPLEIEDTVISISSEAGLEHNSDYLLDDIFPTHSKIFEITANNVGKYTVTATGGNDFDTADLTVETTKFSIFHSNYTTANSVWNNAAANDSYNCR